LRTSTTLNPVACGNPALPNSILHRSKRHLDVILRTASFCRPKDLSVRRKHNLSSRPSAALLSPYENWCSSSGDGFSRAVTSRLRRMHLFRLQFSSLERTYARIPRLESLYNKRFSNRSVLSGKSKNTLARQKAILTCKSVQCSLRTLAKGANRPISAPLSSSIPEIPIHSSVGPPSDRHSNIPTGHIFPDMPAAS
jgi:hypothetical protein